MGALWSGLRRWRWATAGLAAVAVFAVLAGRFWHPHYGFTRFIQFDVDHLRQGVPELQLYPVFAYEASHRYDGSAYAQIAYHPLLDAPELASAVDHLSYRARRILLSATAWLFAGGEPARIASTYATLNLGVWLAFAILLWRVLPVVDARSWLAWAGVMFSAGALHSVRLALTDLAGALLVTAALALHERGRLRGAFAVLTTAGLARETMLANVAGLWRGPWRSPDAWRANALRAVIVAAPLAAWMAYVHGKTGPGAPGFANFTWPVLGWLEKWIEVAGNYARQPAFRWLNTTTLLALVALTVQAAYFVHRRRTDSPWWRAGLCGVAMMALLGKDVWEGHPGAATRVLLPMSIAFAVFAVRERASLAWLVGGGLSVASGLLALWHVPPAPRELAAGSFSGGTYAARHERGWFGVEQSRRARWAWSEGNGELVIDLAPRTTAPVQVRLKVRAIAPRLLEVRSGEQRLWFGEVAATPQPIDLMVTPREPGRVVLQLRSDAEPVPEGAQPGARRLSFAVYGVELR